MAKALCPEGYLNVPDRLKVSEVSESSDYGRFIQQQQRKLVMKEYSDIYKRMKSMTKYELLNECILNTDIDIKNLLDSFHDTEQSMRGFLYEALWDIVIKCNRLDYYNSKNNFVHVVSRVENNQLLDLATVNNTKSYLKQTKVYSGKSGGISDITLKQTDDNDGKWACERVFTDTNQKNKYVLMSVKYYAKEKHIDKYNVENIVNVMEVYKKRFPQQNIDYKIVLVVKDKHAFLQNLSRMKSYKFYYRLDIDHVFDLDDLCAIIDNMRTEEPNSLFLENNNAKPSLTGRFHQLLFVNKTIDKIFGYNYQKPVKRMLWGQIARSGKTYCAGLLIAKLNEHHFFKNSSRILIITPAPTETKEQFTKDLIQFFEDFKNFDMVEYNARFNELNYEQKKKTVFICSKQFLQGSKESEDDADKLNMATIKEKCQFFKNKVDLIVFDEIHYGGTTDVSKQILREIDPYEKAIHVYLTATYKKPVLLHNLDIEHELMTWGLNEIQMAKHISLKESREQLYEIYGRSYVDETVNELALRSKKPLSHIYEDIEDEYRKYPTLHVITSQFDEERVQDIVSDNPYLYGFDINSVFELKEDKKSFINEQSLNNILTYIGDTSNPRSIYSRMQNTLQTYQQNRIFTSQLWFIPFYEDNRIKDVAKAFKALIETHHLFKDYCVIKIVGANDTPVPT